MFMSAKEYSDLAFEKRFASNCGICPLSKFAPHGPWEHTQTCPMIPQTLMNRIPLLHLALWPARSGPQAPFKKRKGEILVRSLKTQHGKGDISLHKHARPATVTLCCYLTWLEHALHSLIDSCGIQICKCLFVSDGPACLADPFTAWREIFARLASRPSGQSTSRLLCHGTSRYMNHPDECCPSPVLYSIVCCHR